MALRTTTLGLKLIEAFEADKLIGYRCPAGVNTISRGITGPALEEAELKIHYANGKMSDQVIVGARITQAESDRLYEALIDHFENKVERVLGKAGERLEPHQFDACVSLAWNIGTGAFANSSACRYIKAGQFDKVPAAFMLWNKASGKPMAGLTRRRRAEAALWECDIEDAESYLGQKLGRMPQRVDPPQPPKPMSQSAIGNGTVLTGAAGTIASGKVIADQVTEVAAAGKDVWQIAMDLGPWVILAVVVLAGAFYVWNERRRKLHEECF